MAISRQPPFAKFRKNLFRLFSVRQARRKKVQCRNDNCEIQFLNHFITKGIVSYGLIKKLYKSANLQAQKHSNLNSLNLKVMISCLEIRNRITLHFLEFPGLGYVHLDIKRKLPYLPTCYWRNNKKLISIKICFCERSRNKFLRNFANGGHREIAITTLRFLLSCLTYRKKSK